LIALKIVIALSSPTGTTIYKEKEEEEEEEDWEDVDKVFNGAQHLLTFSLFS
jgi:hypothetical protein